MIFGRVRRRLLITNMVAMAIVIGALGTGVVLLMDNQLMAQEQSTLVGDAHVARKQLLLDVVRNQPLSKLQERPAPPSSKMEGTNMETQG